MSRGLILVIIFLFLSSFNSYSQDPCPIRISILTLSPGDQVETVFGHSAIRIKNDSTNDDLVYNYGTFDFNQPNFLSKFINGKLPYYLSNEDFLPFVEFYKAGKRTISEQILNLTCKEKHNIVQFLYNNLQGTNKFYRYDFISDNCTTRLREIIEKNAESKVYFKRVVPGKSYYRKLLHADLDYHDHQWMKLGIDLLLGSRTDKIMTDKEVMFLPDYLMATIGSSTIGNKPLVLSKINLSGEESPQTGTNFFIHPLFILSLFSILVVYLSWINKQRVNEILIRFDGLVFFLFGAIGMVLIYLWAFSDQLNYRENYNLLWAWPTHLLFSFFSFKRYQWVRNYFKIVTVVYPILVIVWFFLPQHLNPSLIPLVLLVGYRSWIRGFRPTFI